MGEKRLKNMWQDRVTGSYILPIPKSARTGSFAEQITPKPGGIVVLHKDPKSREGSKYPKTK